MSLYGWEVQIPPTVEYIGEYAFSFDGISKVNLPCTLKTKSDSAVYSNNLTEIKIPESVTYIGTLTFNRNKVILEDEKWNYKRDSSKSKKIDYSTMIGYAGENRNNLEIPSTKNGIPLTRIVDNCFRYSDLRGKLKIPSSVKSIGILSFALNCIKDVDNGGGKWSGPNIYARFGDGRIDYSKLINYTDYGTNTVTLPNNIKYLSDYAFYYTGIHHINMPEVVKTIGNYCFDICNLEGEVVIPSTVTSIGRGAFEKAIHWTRVNADVVKNINKTGKSFDWQAITTGSSPATFKEGTVENWYGDIQVVAS